MAVVTQLATQLCFGRFSRWTMRLPTLREGEIRLSFRSTAHNLLGGGARQATREADAA
ncbi:hypothetical protein GCM10018953_18390 [Streptosporangium nondiastaticum]